MGVLSGGKKLLQKLRDLTRKVDEQHTLKVGFLEGATYPDEAGTSVAQVAFWLNYGSKSAPPRPFFTDMVTEKSPKWGDKLARILVLNDYDVEKSLSLMGEGIVGQVQQAIVDMDAPPLSKVTLMLRKMRKEDPDLVVTGATVGEAARRVAEGESVGGVSTKVGVYTGHLLNSAAYQVDNNEQVMPGEP